MEKSMFPNQSLPVPEVTEEKKLITVDNYIPPNVGTYKIISFEKYKANIKNHDIQMNQIGTSCDMFKEYRRSIEEAIKEQKIIDEWNNYLECDGYPHTHIPSEIREYLYKIELFEKQLSEKTDSWLLNIEERSILNQDLDAKFYTRDALKKYKIDYCNKYDNFIGKLLEVLKLLESTLKTRYKVDSIITYDDLLELKIETHYKIKDLIEKLSYKIISNADSQMSITSVQTSEFVCSTDNFKMYIWTFNNIPIIIDETRFHKMNIPIQCMTAKISLPLNVLEPNLTLRVIQLNYDHYSEFVASYNDIINPFRINFQEYLILEWEKKVALQKKIKDKLKRERDEYEEYLKAKEELEAKLKAQKKSGGDKMKEKSSKKKLQVEPPAIIMPNEYPDIESDFLEQENEIFKAVIDNLHPRKYNFDNNEINMRQYIPLGGIYEFNFLLKPDQIIYPFIAIGLKTDVIPCILKTHLKKCYHEDNTDIESIASEINEDHPKILKYYVIKIQIPTKYVKWAEPIPCQFIPGYDVFQTQQKDEINLDDIKRKAKENVSGRKSRKSKRITVTGRRSTKLNTRKSLRRSKKSNASMETLTTDSELETAQTDLFEKQPSMMAIGTIRAKKDTEDFESTTKWTTKYILKKKFNKEKGEMKIWTDRLGIFAFMYPKYIHFPYKSWNITSTNPSEVIFVVDSPLAKYTFKISEKGYVPFVTNYYEKFNDRVTYFKTLEPISDIDRLKYIMIEQNLNIFPAMDTEFYLEGRFSQKIFALENHTYDCIAAYSTYIQFHRSEWNCIAGYRNIILKCGENAISQDKLLDLVQINTDEARYVSIEEVCTDLSKIILDYKIAREIDCCADLFNLISISHPGSFFSRVRNAKLFLYVSEILKTIQPLSFS